MNVKRARLCELINFASSARSFVRNTQQTYQGGANSVDAKYLASYGTQVVRQKER